MRTELIAVFAFAFLLAVARAQPPDDSGPPGPVEWALTNQALAEKRLDIVLSLKGVLENQGASFYLRKPDDSGSLDWGTSHFSADGHTSGVRGTGATGSISAEVKNQEIRVHCGIEWNRGSVKGSNKISIPVSIGVDAKGETSGFKYECVWVNAQEVVNQHVGDAEAAILARYGKPGRRRTFAASDSIDGTRARVLGEYFAERPSARVREVTYGTRAGESIFWLSETAGKWSVISDRAAPPAPLWQRLEVPPADSMIADGKRRTESKGDRVPHKRGLLSLRP